MDVLTGKKIPFLQRENYFLRENKSVILTKVYQLKGII